MAAVDILGSLCMPVRPGSNDPRRVCACIVASQDLISGRVISQKLGDLSKRLFCGFKTTTGDGMI